MKRAGQVVLFRFPQTDHYTAGFDETVGERDADFADSGLKVSSVIRLGRLTDGCNRSALSTQHSELSTQH
jgi:hypothetical protein